MKETPREQLVKLQALMKDEQTIAVSELMKILDRVKVKEAVTEITTLRERFIPGSTEESQLDAFVNVYNSISSYFNAVYPVVEVPLELTASA